MDDMNALHFAAKQGHTEVARALLNAGAVVNAKTRKGLNALQVRALPAWDDCLRMTVDKHQRCLHMAVDRPQHCLHMTMDKHQQRVAPVEGLC
jgi:ankyrin repeat protein